MVCSAGREDVRLESPPAAERAPILIAYLQIAGGARPQVLVDKDALTGEFDKIAPEHLVFRMQASPHGKKSSGNE
jgi:hypothetical protein